MWIERNAFGQGSIYHCTFRALWAYKNREMCERVECTMKADKGFQGKRWRLLLTVISPQMKSSWRNFWLSFPRGMVFVQWCNMQWEIKPHVACRKKERKKTLFNVFNAPRCMIQSETGFSLHHALASRRACPMGVRPRSQAAMADKCGCAVGWSDPAGLKSGNHLGAMHVFLAT